ncbi:MAG: tRNA (adenosine(37)-N6)-dimethylallyltransferase MiaA [Chloroflexi bacterium]|nr:tRNA (adenosine(37)-N6)-dimethylallyltransferase MiaA [Chloroflexota bacterium]
MKPLVVILGPTAAGKSQLALRLAQKFNGEIVGADSRQVYRHMDIGTAKPTRAEMFLVPHRLIDIINPDEDFSLAQYQRLAYQAIDDIQQWGKLPLLVGGSGLYIWGVVEGWQIPEVAPDREFRRWLEGRAARGEAAALYAELAQVNPETAERIDPRNIRRVIRALEIAKDPKAAQPLLKVPPPYEILLIGLTAERKELYRRIDARVDSMIEQGLVDEVKKLLETGYTQGLPSMSGIGYKQVILHLKGELTLEMAVQQIKTETHRLVRRQYNWFRLTDARIKWFDIEDGKTEAGVEGVVAGFISS